MKCVMEPGLIFAMLKIIRSESVTGLQDMTCFWNLGVQLNCFGGFWYGISCRYSTGLRNVFYVLDLNSCLLTKHSATSYLLIGFWLCSNLVVVDVICEYLRAWQTDHQSETWRIAARNWRIRDDDSTRFALVPSVIRRPLLRHSTAPSYKIPSLRFYNVNSSYAIRSLRESRL